MEKLLSTLWRIIGVISVLVIVVFVWLFFFVPKPQTTSTNYISALSMYDEEDTALEDATIVANFNIYKNKNANGTKLFEYSMTTYQGTNHEEIYTKGVQIMGDLKTSSYVSHKTTRWQTLGGLIKNFYLWYDIDIDNLYSYDISYDKGDGIAFASPTSLNNNSEFIVSVGQGENAKLAKLRFRKEVVKNNSNNWFGSYDGWLTYWYNNDLIGLNYMICSLYDTVYSLDAGTHFVTFDLAEFFDVLVMNDKGQFIEQTTDTQYTYVTCKVNVSDDGMTTKSQSMFGMVAQNDGSAQFEIDESPNLFWKAYENVTITNCFETRYSNYYASDLLHITDETITKYKNYKDLRIHLVIDLSEYENVIGIDSFGLDGLNYYDITIIGNEQDFYFMSNSLINTKVNTIYHADNVNIVLYDNADVNLQVVA